MKHVKQKNMEIRPADRTYDFELIRILYIFVVVQHMYLFKLLYVKYGIAYAVYSFARAQTHA